MNKWMAFFYPATLVWSFDMRSSTKKTSTHSVSLGWGRLERITHLSSGIRLLVPSQLVFKENEAHHTDLTNRTFYFRQEYHTKERDVLILYVISYSKRG